jgi:NTE family protein
MRIAIACQGGGTHAAFTWGVLTQILRARAECDSADPDDPAAFEITALSGTSAGALCALAAFYGMAPNRDDAEMGSPEAAIERLDHLWTTFAATTPTELAVDRWTAAALRWKSAGLPMADTGPYDPAGVLALAGLALAGARDEYLGFPALLRDLCPHFDAIDWPGVAERRLRLVAGAIEVLSGNTETFDSDRTLADLGLLAHAGPSGNRWRMRRPLSLEGIAASGTLPEVLPAQPIPDMEFPTCAPGDPVVRTGYYWDGLYSQNPPVGDLLDAPVVDAKPDEIWVIRINPQEFPRPAGGVGLDAIRDRENSLAGNLSLNQELDHVLSVNRWIGRYGNAHPPLDTRKSVTVRTIKMSRETALSIGHVSKLDRSPAHIARLHEEGLRVGAAWLDERRRLGDDMPRYPDDARYPEAEAGVDR